MNRYIQELFKDRPLPVVSNPEYLREGEAIKDFLHPFRIVLGADDRRAAEAVGRLYASIGAPVFVTDPMTAELSKLASNAFLALKVSFANTVGRIARSSGADPTETLRIVASDPRIAPGHLTPGLGFGGACLPKDLLAMEHLARRVAAPYDIFAGALAVNADQRRHVIDVMLSRLGTLSGQTIAVLGLAFKPDTDDVRESPALSLAADLQAAGASVVVHDPVARLPEADASFTQRRTPLAAVRGADAVVFATAWDEYRHLRLPALRRAMRGNLLVDGRGIVDATRAASAGFDYVAIGVLGA
jgi:UDPglucose 6-dehydrogenase